MLSDGRLYELLPPYEPELPRAAPLPEDGEKRWKPPFEEPLRGADSFERPDCEESPPRAEPFADPRESLLRFCPFDAGGVNERKPGRELETVPRSFPRLAPEFGCENEPRLPAALPASLRERPRFDGALLRFDALKKCCEFADPLRIVEAFAERPLGL